MNQDRNQTRVRFVCVENAGKSQMSEVFARRKGLQAASVGTAPAESVCPIAAAAMAEKAFSS